MSRPSGVVEFQQLARARGRTEVQIDDDPGPRTGRAYMDLALSPEGLDPLVAKHYREAVAARVPTRARCNVVYGPIYTEDVRENGKYTGWCRLLNPEWESRALVTIELPAELCKDGKPLSLRVHRKMAAAVYGLIADAVLYLRAHPGETWRVDQVCGWPGAPRHIGRDVKRNLSRHSWAAAIDFNWIRQRLIPAWFFVIARLWGFVCGADWDEDGDDRPDDPMHIEWLKRNAK